MSSLILLFIAGALVVAPPRSARRRLAPGSVLRDVSRRWRWPWAREGPVDPLALAAGWDLLSTGLRGGLDTAAIVRAVAGEVGGEPARVLREVVDLLVLGGDPVAAWEPALRHPATTEFGRAARRTARSGSALAASAEDAAARERVAAGQHAQACARRAEVWVALPLGLCFLPAFLCLGVAPVVIGMLHQLTSP